MAALVLGTDIPSNINTLEELTAWCLLTSHNLFGGTTYQELEGGLLERQVDCNIVRAADGSLRIISRCSFRLNPEYVTGNLKLWEYVLPLGDTAIPAAFKSN